MRNFEKRIIRLEQIQRPDRGLSIYLMTEAECQAMLDSGAIEQMNAAECLALLGHEPTSDEIAAALAGDDRSLAD